MEVNSNVESVSNLHSNQNDSPSQDTGLVSKDGYKKVSSLTLYMPERINLNRLLLEQPPDFRYDKDNFVYIIHLVTAIPSRKRDMIDAYGGYTPINRKFLQKRIHGYKKYIDYLKSHEVVVERSSYSPGKYSMGLKNFSTI